MYAPFLDPLLSLCYDDNMATEHKTDEEKKKDETTGGKYKYNNRCRMLFDILLLRCYEDKFIRVPLRKIHRHKRKTQLDLVYTMYV